MPCAANPVFEWMNVVALLAVAASMGCTGIAAGAALSVNSTVGEKKIDLSGGLGLTVVLLFVPVDILLTVGVVTGELELGAIEPYRREIRTDIARGGGPQIEQLAAVLGLDDAEAVRLGALVQRHRDRLDAPLADPTPLDRARLETFAGALRGALAEDPAIALKAARVAEARRARR